MRVVVYECQEPLNENERFLSFLVQEVTVTDKKTKAVSKRLERLPVAFRSNSYDGSRETALRFWDEETAKKQQKQERGRTLASRRKKTCE